MHVCVRTYQPARPRRPRGRGPQPLRPLRPHRAGVARPRREPLHPTRPASAARWRTATRSRRRPTSSPRAPGVSCSTTGSTISSQWDVVRVAPEVSRALRGRPAGHEGHRRGRPQARGRRRRAERAELAGLTPGDGEGNHRVAAAEGPGGGAPPLTRSGSGALLRALLRGAGLLRALLALAPALALVLLALRVLRVLRVLLVLLAPPMPAVRRASGCSSACPSSCSSSRCWSSRCSCSCWSNRWSSRSSSSGRRRCSAPAGPRAGCRCRRWRRPGRSRLLRPRRR